VAYDLGLERGRAYPPAYDPANWWVCNNYYYYDLGKVLAIQAARTGEAEFLTLFRKCVDSWWTRPGIESGTQTDPTRINPKDVALAGLMLRALDGKPEYWPWIVSYTRFQAKQWIVDHIERPSAVPGGNEASLKLFMWDVRELGYTLQYAAILAKAHPDATVRTEFQALCTRTLTELIIPRQWADGSFRYYHPNYAGSGLSLWNTEQPLMTGLLLEGMAYAHRLLGDTTIATAITRAVDHLSTIYRRDAVADKPGITWRGYANRWGGGDDAHPLACEQPLGCRDAGHNPAGVLSMPSETANTEGGSVDLVREARQYATMVLHGFGYAYHLTGDAKYKTQGDEIQDACFGGGDGFKCYADAPSTPKCYPQAFRSSLTYPALVGSSVTPVPLQPTPVPPQPTPPCSITGPASVTIPRNSEGQISLTVSNSTTVTIDVLGSDGQVTVTPLSKTVSGTSAVVSFRVRVKRQSRTITFQSGCGSVVTRVNVT
jgi:hypothetical protein